LNYLGNVERYAFKSGFIVGDDDKSLNGTNKTNVQLFIDTRNQWSFLFDLNCSTCINKNESRYSFNPNSTVKDGISTKNVSSIIFDEDAM